MDVFYVSFYVKLVGLKVFEGAGGFCAIRAPNDYCCVLVCRLEKPPEAEGFSFSCLLR